MPDFSYVNWVAVIVAAVAHLVLGFVWYLPQVFGTRWAAATGRTLPSGSPPPMTLVYMVVAALLVAIGIGLYGADGLVNGALRGALFWLYFVAPVTAAAVFFEGRSWMWWAISAGYWLVGMVIMGAIVGVL